MDKRIVAGSAIVFSLLSACGGGSVQPIPAPPHRDKASSHS